MKIAFVGATESDKQVYSALSTAANEASVPIAGILKSPQQIYGDARITDVFLSTIHTRLMRQSIIRMRQKGVKIHHVQVGMLSNPYNIVFPTIDFYYTHGDYWSSILKRSNPKLKTLAVGSVKVDLILKYRTEIKPIIAVISQPTQKFMPNFPWVDYVHNIQNFAKGIGHRIIFRTHYNEKRNLSIHTNRDWKTFACCSYTCTMYSTLGLEAAAAGIPTFSYVPLTHHKIVNFETFGIQTVSRLNQLEGLHAVDPENFSYYINNCDGSSAAQKIINNVKGGECART